MAQEEGSKVEGWLKKVEDALQTASDAVADAWNATEGTRRQAWETAKKAIDQASAAVEEGMEVAKSTWDRSTGGEGAPAGDDSGESATAESEDEPTEGADGEADSAT